MVFILGLILFVTGLILEQDKKSEGIAEFKKLLYRAVSSDKIYVYEDARRGGEKQKEIKKEHVVTLLNMGVFVVILLNEGKYDEISEFIKHIKKKENMEDEAFQAFKLLILFLYNKQKKQGKEAKGVFERSEKVEKMVGSIMIEMDKIW